MYKQNGKPLTLDRPFTVDGVTYPPSWLRQASEADKAALGIVWEADPEPVDYKFYWDHGIPREINDREEVDENGQPMFVKVLDKSDPQNPQMVDSDERLVTRGLKYQFKQQVDQQVFSLLAPSDYKVIRQVEGGKPMDATWKAWRAQVRAVATTIKADIDACATLEELKDVVNNYIFPEAPKQ